MKPDLDLGRGRFAALLFDMDGLLLDSEREFMEALVELAVPLGFSDAEVRQFYVGLVGTSSAVSEAALRTFLPDHVDAAAFDEAWRARNAERRKSGVSLMPFVGEVLPALAAAGYRLAVVTSTQRAPALAHLEQAGLLEHFELVVAGDEVAANKPDPAPYLQAAQGLGVDPANCAAFEDSDLGTQAAVAAGCVTTQIPDLRPDKPLPEFGQFVASDLRKALVQIGVIDRALK